MTGDFTISTKKSGALAQKIRCQTQKNQQETLYNQSNSLSIAFCTW